MHRYTQRRWSACAQLGYITFGSPPLFGLVQLPLQLRQSTVLELDSAIEIVVARGRLDIAPHLLKLLA